MDTHQLLVENVLTLAEDLLGLTPSRFLSFALPSLVFGEFDHGSDAAFLLQTHQLFGQVVHCLRDDLRLEGFSDAVHYAFLVVVDEIALLRQVTLLTPFFSQAEFGDEVKALLLAFEHAVLFGSSSEQSLEEKDGPLSLVLLEELGSRSTSIRPVHKRCGWSHIPFSRLVIIVSSSRPLCQGLLDLHVDDALGLLERFQVLVLFTGLRLLEVVTNHVDVDFRIKDMRLLALKESMKFT